jgi:hypothetical protein
VKYGPQAALARPDPMNRTRWLLVFTALLIGAGVGLGAYTFV